MKLQKMPPRGTPSRPPLRTLTEIAEILGITMQELMWALKHAGEAAPKPAMRGNEAGHHATGNNKVWYEPKEVLRWYRTRPPEPPPEGPAASRKLYFREYYRNNLSVAAKREKLKQKLEETK